MGLLDITIGSEDQETLIGTTMFVAGAIMTATGVGAAPGVALMAAGGGIAAQGIGAKGQREQQEKAQSDLMARNEKARYDSLLRQVSAEVQADQSVLATLNSGSNNSNKQGKPGVDTQQNKQIGSSTSGTF